MTGKETVKKGEVTRLAIETAAIQLFLKQGYHATYFSFHDNAYLPVSREFALPSLPPHPSDAIASFGFGVFLDPVYQLDIQSGLAANSDNETNLASLRDFQLRDARTLDAVTMHDPEKRPPRHYIRVEVGR